MRTCSLNDDFPERVEEAVAGPPRQIAFRARDAPQQGRAVNLDSGGLVCRLLEADDRQTGLAGLCARLRKLDVGRASGHGEQRGCERAACLPVALAEGGGNIAAGTFRRRAGAVGGIEQGHQAQQQEYQPAFHDAKVVKNPVKGTGIQFDRKIL